MKLIIDIPEEVREHIFDLANDGNEIPLGINAHMVKAIVNGTPIPDNATNGDMIKAMFPQLGVNEEWKATRRFEFKSEECIEITGIATSDWWNAPYERSTDADSD